MKVSRDITYLHWVQRKRIPKHSAVSHHSKCCNTCRELETQEILNICIYSFSLFNSCYDSGKIIVHQYHDCIWSAPKLQTRFSLPADSLHTSLPLPIAMPMSAFFKAGASFT